MRDIDEIFRRVFEFSMCKMREGVDHVVISLMGNSAGCSILFGDCWEKMPWISLWETVLITSFHEWYFRVTVQIDPRNDLPVVFSLLFPNYLGRNAEFSLCCTVRSSLMESTVLSCDVLCASVG